MQHRAVLRVLRQQDSFKAVELAQEFHS